MGLRPGIRRLVPIQTASDLLFRYVRGMQGRYAPTPGIRWSSCQPTVITTFYMGGEVTISGRGPEGKPGQIKKAKGVTYVYKPINTQDRRYPTEMVFERREQDPPIGIAPAIGVLFSRPCSKSGPGTTARR